MRRQVHSPAAGTLHSTSQTGLLLIGLFKLTKAALLLVVAFGIQRLLHHGMADLVGRWSTQLQADPHSRYLHAAVSWLLSVDDRTLREIRLGSFVYAAVFLVEGAGLCLRKRWAEYLTTILTASLLPVEAYEIWQRLTWVRVSLLVVNLAIVGYLVWVIRRPDRER